MDESRTSILIDHLGRQIRLTEERQAHILEHPEMVGQIERIGETLLQPELVVNTTADSTVYVYHRYYESTPVTDKYLLVVVKQPNGDAFVLTAFFSNRPKKGNVTWRK